MIVLYASVFAILALGIPALITYLVWRLFGFSKAKLSLWGATAVFVAGALTSWIFWGHAGPVPVLLMLITKADGEYLPWILWMLGSGLCMVVLFGWLSHRRARASLIYLLTEASWASKGVDRC
jgi:branched-subunit amino acid ABC-type transport system permease component